MIQILTKPGQKVIELGGGANPQFHPNVDVRQCFDSNGNPTVDFLADFNEPLPINSDEWDVVFCQYTLEHISYRKIPQFLKEVLRILKSGGEVVFITANTEAQVKWIESNPEGWDGHGPFESMSCVLFGDQDYEENSHKCYFSPKILEGLFKEAGFVGIVPNVYGPRETDIVIRARKLESEIGYTRPDRSITDLERKGIPFTVAHTEQGIKLEKLESKERASLFDRHYFHGGAKVGGYAREGYWDYPIHEITFRHVLDRKPESVLEIGCARGYIVKRLQDYGINACGIEISKHCYLTRVADGILTHDICKAPWPVNRYNIPYNLGPDVDRFDLAFSIAVLEHIPEEFLPIVLSELKRVCKRGLHGIDFGEKDDDFDKTHCSLHERSWWIKKFREHGLINHEIVNKEELENGIIPEQVYCGDRKVKLNVGSFTTMFHHGWTNLDVHDMSQWAAQYKYNFMQCDVRAGLPFQTGTVDALFASHMLEHLPYREGLSFLRECRRVIKSDGAMRFIVPDTELLCRIYTTHPSLIEGITLSEFDEINDNCANSPTDACRLWELIFSGHSAAYDAKTLCHYMKEAGFIPCISPFRGTSMKEPIRPMTKQILRETNDMIPCLSLFCDAVPLVM